MMQWNLNYDLLMPKRMSLGALTEALISIHVDVVITVPHLNIYLKNLTRKLK